MHRSCGQQFTTGRDLGRAQVVRAASGARTGFLKLRSGDLELDSALGPELSDRAPRPYDRTIRLHDPETLKAHVSGESRVAARSDLQGMDRDGLACATAELQAIRIEVAPRLTIAAAAISARLLLSKEAGRARNTITVELRGAVLEIDGLPSIVLPSCPAPNTPVCPELLRPLGMRLVANVQVQRSASPCDRAVEVAALRLSFDRGAPIGTHHAGEIAVAVVDAALTMELRQPAPAMVGWLPPAQPIAARPKPVNQPCPRSDTLLPPFAPGRFLRSTA